MANSKGTPAYLQIDWLERRIEAQEAEIERLRDKIDHIGVKHPQDLLMPFTRSVEQDHQ